MRPLSHGYADHTVGDGTTVVKRYEGPDAASRLEREWRVLTALAGLVPVPSVIGVAAGRLELGFLPGVHGQEPLEDGDAAAVLRSCGGVPRRLHSARPGPVHGDFGPDDLLLDPETYEVTAVVAWESSHVGEPLEDLAWCEWVVRTHHVGAIGRFFDAYGGPLPGRPARRAAMLDRCAEIRDRCHRWEPDGPGVRLWEERAEATAAWSGVKGPVHAVLDGMDRAARRSGRAGVTRRLAAP